MRIINLPKSSTKTTISTKKFEIPSTETFDIAAFQEANPELIKQLFQNSYEKHIKVITELVVSRIALNSAMHDADRHIAETSTQSSTAPVQIFNEENIENLDAIFTRAFREYAVNASAEIAIDNEEIRKEYVNNYNNKPSGNPKPTSKSHIGVRMSREDANNLENSPMKDIIDKISKEQRLAEGESDSPYGAIERKPDGKLPIVRQSVKTRRT